MRRNVRLQELEQVAKVRDYERCFSLDHRTTNRQGNLWSLYQNGQKDMILMNCHAACIYLPREIFIPCETLSLRELTMQVLLDLELYRILKDDAVSGLPSVK